jgi:hypothetical protein
MLSSNIQKGLSCPNIITALPSSLVNKLGFEEPLLIGLCAFCGLGFAPLWACKITSYKHVYHYWCVYLHFNTSTKCIQARCEEDTHEAWWHFIGIKKPRSVVILDHALVKDPSSRPRHPPKHKVSTSKGIKFSYLSLVSI